MQASLQGYLLKRPEKGIVKKWKKRYFEIIEFKFSYFLGEDKKVLKAVENLQETNGYIEDTSKDKENVFLFAFSVGNRTYHLQASSKEEREKWLGQIARWAQPNSKGKLAGKVLVAVTSELTIPLLPQIELVSKELSEFPAALWKNKRLEQLILSENLITVIPPNVEEFGFLRVLNLSYNKLTTLPDNLFNLSNLEELNVHNNKIKDIPEGIGKLVKLELLVISNNLLQNIPTSIGKLQKLNKISIAFNNLNTLPKDLGECKQISWLDISGNKFDDFPESLFELPNLQFLEATSNNLQSIPENFTSFKFLKEFRASHNKIAVLPPFFGHYAHLQELDVAFNCLTELPKELGTTATFIQVHNNPFKNIPEDVIETGSGAIKAFLKSSK